MATRWHLPGVAERPHDGRRGLQSPTSLAQGRRAVKFGFIPTEGGHFYRQALNEVVLGEELGFDSVWMEEHHGIKDHYWPSPLVVLAGFAANTSKIGLGTDVVVLPFHYPV